MARRRRRAPEAGGSATARPSLRARRLVPWAALLVAIAAAVAARLYFAGHSGLALTSLPDTGVAREANQLVASIAPPASPTSVPPAGLPLEQITPQIRALPTPTLVATGGHLQLWRRPFEAPAAAPPGGPEFSRHDGPELGFVQPPLPRPYLWMDPGTMNQGPLAAGDVNSDGWPDVVVGTAAGVQLYINSGGRFVQEKIDDPAMVTWLVTDVALVDLDGDGAPDLVFCAWKHDCHILWNHGGSFGASEETVLRYAQENTVNALAFADIRRSGRLDLVTGAAVWEPRFFNPIPAVSRVWYNDGARHFHVVFLPGASGETTSLLFTDLNGDGWPDLWVGHDFDERDVFYRNDHGTLTYSAHAFTPLPYTTDQTMSIDSGDLTHDGTLALYESSIADRNDALQASALQQLRVRNPAASCDVYGASPQRAVCNHVATYQVAVLDGYDKGTIDSCKGVVPPAAERDCVMSAYQWDGVLARLPNNGGDKSLEMLACSKVPRDFAEYLDICAAMALSPFDREHSEAVSAQVHQLPGRNLLFVKNHQGYGDATDHWGAAYGGWSWNAKFADLSNDGWQDLFITQGTRQRRQSPSNLYYHNLGGKGFSESATAAGLEDHNPTGASLFLDAGEEGALDILTYPFLLTPVEWHNDHPAGQELELALEDRTVPNHAGVGARVELRAPDGRLQIREIKGSGGYESHDEPVAHFGLGDWPSVATITVTWPDGSAQVLDGQTLGPGRYTLVRT